MPAINFQKQFIDLIVSGEKRQTVRPIRKNPIKTGDTLMLYVGMRTKQCRKLREVVCKEVLPIQISLYGQIFLDEEYLSLDNIIDLARADGFCVTLNFFEFFNKQYGLPFSGALIRW